MYVDRTGSQLHKNECQPQITCSQEPLVQDPAKLNTHFQIAINRTTQIPVKIYFTHLQSYVCNLFTLTHSDFQWVMKMISSKCLPSRAMHCCSLNVKLRIAEICNITPNGYSLTMKRSLMVLSRVCFGPVWKTLRSPINGNGLRHYRVDGQVQHLPASSRKQPAFQSSHVPEVPGPLLFCMGGILSPDVKFSAH